VTTPQIHLAYPKGPEKDQECMLRGSLWMHYDPSSRSAQRYSSSPYKRCSDFGFQVARD